MKFSGAVGCTPGRSDQILGPITTIIARRVNTVKQNGGLEEVCTL